MCSFVVIVVVSIVFSDGEPFILQLFIFNKFTLNLLAEYPLNCKHILFSFKILEHPTKQAKNAHTAPSEDQTLF